MVLHLCSALLLSDLLTFIFTLDLAIFCFLFPELFPKTQFIWILCYVFVMSVFTNYTACNQIDDWALVLRRGRQIEHLGPILASSPWLVIRNALHLFIGKEWQQRGEKKWDKKRREEIRWEVMRREVEWQVTGRPLHFLFPIFSNHRQHVMPREIDLGSESLYVVAFLHCAFTSAKNTSRNTKITSNRNSALKVV